MSPPPPPSAVRIQGPRDASGGWSYIILEDQATGLVYYEFYTDNDDVFWAAGQRDGSATAGEIVEATESAWGRSKLKIWAIVASLSLGGLIGGHLYESSPGRFGKAEGIGLALGLLTGGVVAFLMKGPQEIGEG